MACASSNSASQALLLDAELAGAAMACRYSSSDEYEAALISERRRAGVYRKPAWDRSRRWIFCMIAGATALIALSFVW